MCRLACGAAAEVGEKQKTKSHGQETKGEEGLSNKRPLLWRPPSGAFVWRRDESAAARCRDGRFAGPFNGGARRAGNLLVVEREGEVVVEEEEGAKGFFRRGCVVVPFVTGRILGLATEKSNSEC